MPADREFLRAYAEFLHVKDGKLFNGNEEVDLMKGEDGNVLLQPKDPIAEAQKMSRAFYKQRLSKPFENVIVLSGAGTSVSSGGKTVGELWDGVFPASNEKENKDFFELIGFNDDNKKNLEECLSQCLRARLVLSTKAQKNKIEAKITEMKELIKNDCSLTLADDSPHLQFLNKLTSRKSKHNRIKIFTLNYDTLFEQAAVQGNYTVINGFSFSTPSYFSGEFFDFDIVNRKYSRMKEEENFVPKVFQLYKPHGSLNWEEDRKKGRVFIKEGAEDPLLIFPNADKYEAGYDQPFFEMMSRFQESVRRPNTLLIAVGFSFEDKHFRNVILEAIKSNQSLNLLIINRSIEKNKKPQLKNFIELADKQDNIVLVSELFEGFVENFPFSIEYEHEPGT